MARISYALNLLLILGAVLLSYTALSWYTSYMVDPTGSDAATSAQAFWWIAVITAILLMVKYKLSKRQKIRELIKLNSDRDVRYIANLEQIKEINRSPVNIAVNLLVIGAVGVFVVFAIIIVSLAIAWR